MMTYDEMVEAGRVYMRAELKLHVEKKTVPKEPEVPFSIESQAEIDAYQDAQSNYATQKRSWELRVEYARDHRLKAKSKVLDGFITGVWVIFDCDGEIISLRKIVNGVNRDVEWTDGKVTKTEEQAHE